MAVDKQLTLVYVLSGILCSMNDTTLPTQQETYFGINKKIIIAAVGIILIACAAVGGKMYTSRQNVDVPVVTSPLQTQPYVVSDTSHTFDKYGFTFDIPKSLFSNVTCYPDFMRTPGEAKNGGTFGSFCKNSLKSKPFIQVGWKDKNLNNTDFSLKVAAELVNRYFGANKKFTSVCDNHTGIAVTVDAGFSSRAFSCKITVEGGKTFTAIYYIFYIGKLTDTTNWITISDPEVQGSATNEKMIELAKSIKILAPKKQSTLFNMLFDSVYAGVDDSDGGDGSGEGSEGGSGSSGPNLSDGSGGTVSDGSGNAVGTGGGSYSGGNSGDGNSSPVPPPTPVNGMCAATHYNCSTGVLGSTADYPTSGVPNVYAWQWWCNGTDNGTNILCNEDKPNPTGSLSASPLSCQIATGASTCATTLTWSTANPRGTSGITRDGTAGLLFSANSDSRVTNVPYEADGAIIYRLYNNAAELGNATIAVACASGANKWDTAHSVCADPQVVSAVVRGEYYPPGAITLTCSNSDTYSVTLEGSPYIATTPYSGPAVISVSQEGNYTLKCMYGNISSQTVRFYDAIPPPATVSLEVSPVTIAKDGKVTASWKTKFPTNACSLTAKVVCPNDACTAQQTSFQSALNNKLQTEKTDSNDPATSRLIPTAIKVVAPGHLDTDWLALGRKTLQISYTTDLIYDCGGTSKQTKRIQVTKLEDQ